MPRIGTIAYYYNFNRGKKLFELTNHLGNVLATITDTKIPVRSGASISYYTANIINATEYHPFGMRMRGRDTTLQAYNTAYRYGYNGKEQDRSITSQDYDYGMRIYDARVGRFLSVDPLLKKYPFYSPYQFAGNNPVKFIDLDGLEPENNPTAPGVNETRAMNEDKLIETKAARNDVQENLISKSVWLASDQEIAGTYFCNPTGEYISDTKKESADKFNMYVYDGATFNVDESQASHTTNYESFITHRLMSNFTSGEGPENYNFATNGIISSKFLNSDILKKALKQLNNGQTVQNVQMEFKKEDLGKDILRTGTMFSSISGFVGSGTITLTPTAEGVKVKIFNITSLTSGAYSAKVIGEFTGNDKLYPKSYVRDPNKKTPFGNISQTFNLLIPYDSPILNHPD